MEAKGFTETLRRMLFGGIIFSVFFQLLTEFVEAIYLYGLLGTDIPPEIGMVLLFFSPALLLVFKKPFTTTKGWQILLSIALIARVIEISLPTRGRLIASGIGLAAILLFFPAFLAAKQKSATNKGFTKETGAGLTLAIFLLILFRALNSGSDISAQGMFRIISWLMILAGLILTWRQPSQSDQQKIQTQAKIRFPIYLFALGISGIFVLLYFAFTAPNIMARWSGSSNMVIHVILLTSWTLFSAWWIRQETISSKLVLGIGLVFVACLMLSILPSQVAFPPTMENGYPLLEPPVTLWNDLAVYAAVALSPVLLLAFTNYLNGLMQSKPTPRALAGAFSLGAGFMLVMVLAQVFTTVYDYIPVIGPAFRDKYWLVFLLPAIIALLPMVVYRKPQSQGGLESPQARRILGWFFTWIVFTVAIGIAASSAIPPTPRNEKKGLRVFTYNIQQGFDDQGERNFEGQLKYISSMSPDIIGLQECDTARIAGGNADLVAYLANHLNMHAYYGPSSVAGTFGIALLSRYPIENAKTYYLFSYGEQVAVIVAEINIEGKTFNIFITHLGNSGPIFQMEQMLELMSGKSNVIAMGDYNFRPYEEQYAITTAKYQDAYLIAQSKTIPSFWGEVDPFDIEERIDHIFISEELQVPYLEYLTQPESDHPGLFAEIGW